MLAPIACVCVLVVAPPLALRLDKFKEESPGCYVFAGTRGVMKGKKIYSRARMFERIERLTGIRLKTERPPRLPPRRDCSEDRPNNIHARDAAFLAGHDVVYSRVVLEENERRRQGFWKIRAIDGGTIFERTFRQNWPNDAREVITPMEYFTIHAKRWLFWAVLGIGLIIALGLGSQIIDSIFTPSECVLDRCNLEA